MRRIGELGTTSAETRWEDILRVYGLVTANVPSSTILFTLMMESIRSSETSDLTAGARRHIPEDGILHSRRREYIISYTALTGLTL
jgi:hypothetical protein